MLQLRTQLRAVMLIAMVGMTLLSPEAQGNQKKALNLYQSLNGVPMKLDDSRLETMTQLIEQKKLLEAAAIASEDDYFINLTVRHWASSMSNRGEFQTEPLNDFVLTVMGHTNAEADMRELLYGDFAYVGTVGGAPAPSPNNNNHYLFLENSRANLKRSMQKQSPQRPGIPGAGLFTTRAWGKAHLSNGTNRRAVEFTFREFLCEPFAQVRDKNVPMDRIRQDVTRTPGGAAQIFSNKCATCHGILDAFAGAFAFWNYRFETADEDGPGTLHYRSDPGADPAAFNSQGIAVKMLKDPQIYTPGYITFDESWKNYANVNSNRRFEFQATEGVGIAEFGQMIANSPRFPYCMAKRTYSQLCLKKDFHPERMTEDQLGQLDAADGDIRALSEKFINHGYNLRKLFEETAILPKCINR